jgi:hypothetical protein
VRLHSVLQLIIRETTASLRLQVDDVRCRFRTVCQHGLLLIYMLAGITTVLCI